MAPIKKIDCFFYVYIDIEVFIRFIVKMEVLSLYLLGRTKETRENLRIAGHRF